MGMKVKYQVKHDDLEGMTKRLKVVDGTSVEVGVLKGEHKWLAGIHEYGCNIEVTPKMRAWFHYQGVHLSKDTTHIHIPERSFLRTGYDTHRDEVMNKAQRILKDVASGKTSARGCYQAVGMELASKIKDYAVGLNSPGNSGFTADRKGSSNPLVDTGDMIGGITWRKG